MKTTEIQKKIEELKIELPEKLQKLRIAGCPEEIVLELIWNEGSVKHHNYHELIWFYNEYMKARDLTFKIYGLSYYLEHGYFPGSKRNNIKAGPEVVSFRFGHRIPTNDELLYFSLNSELEFEPDPFKIYDKGGIIHDRKENT